MPRRPPQFFGARSQPGPMGHPGRMGSRGPRGQTGATGPAGRRGKLGKPGKTGLRGLTGAMRDENIIHMVMTHFDDLYDLFHGLEARVTQLNERIDTVIDALRAPYETVKGRK